MKASISGQVIACCQFRPIYGVYACCSIKIAF